MSKLTLEPNIDFPDELYADLLDAHEGLSKQQSDAFNARLILLLANQIGKRETFQQALKAAKLEG